MSVTDKIDKFLDEAKIDKNKKIIIKKKGSGYESWTYFRSGFGKSSSPIKMKDFDSVTDAEKWAKKNGWNIRIAEALDEAKMSPAQIEYIANSLSEKEWFVLGLMIGYKPNARISELEHWTRQYNIPISTGDYKTILDSLFSKKAIQKNRVAPHTREVWEFKFGNKLPSQVHHWAKDLKF